MFDDVLEHWTAEEVATLTSLLARFNDDFAEHHHRELGRTPGGDASGVPPDTPGHRPATDVDAHADPEDLTR
jgi:hypothetical protein